MADLGSRLERLEKRRGTEGPMLQAFADEADYSAALDAARETGREQAFLRGKVYMGVDLSRV